MTSVESRVGEQPLLDGRGLVRRVIVDDEVDVEFLRHRSVDEGQGLLELDGSVLCSQLMGHLAGTTATAALTSSLTSTYQAETAALATYRNVVAALGPVGPFPNVITAEQQHASTVSALFTRYGIALPAPGTGQSSPGTRTAACALGVSVEQQLIALYGGELPKVAAYPDVTTAFQNLLAASRDDHLPAFQHCA